MTRLPLVGRTGRLTWRTLATTLGGQSLVLLFGALVARGQAIAAGRDDAGTLLWGGCGLALLAIVAAGLMRGPLGLPLGWLVQLLTWLSALVVPAMLGVALVFTAIWVLCLVKGQEADALVAARAEEARRGR